MTTWPGVQMTNTGNNVYKAEIPTDAQYALGKASARIPGWDYQQVPFIDAWGREEETGLLPMRALNNFLNPAYTSSMNVTPVDAEIQRLYNATGTGSVVPSRADRSITVDGEKVDLTGEQYVEYATKKGQTAFDVLSSIIDTSAYKKLSDTEKTKLIFLSSVDGGVAAFPHFTLSDGMSKAAVAFLAKQLAAENVYTPIDVFCVSPGSVETGMFYASTLQYMTPEVREQFARHQAKKRLIQPRDVAYWLCELLKDESTLLHGANIDASMGLGCRTGIQTDFLPGEA